MIIIKIDVITMHAIKNYGSALQTFATQEFFKSFGCEVEIINYIRNDARDENLIHYWSNGNFFKQIVIAPTIQRWKKIFGDFYNKNVNISNGVYTTVKDFEKFELNADLYCTGSDQVWNSKWNKGIEWPLYLSFLEKNQYKFSFASSFGQDHLNDEEVNETKTLINEYNYISVREKKGIEILEKQYGYSRAEHLIDPTLCLDADTWRRLSSNGKKYRDINNYILVYNLNRSKNFDQYAKLLAKKTGLKLVRFCTRYDQFFRVGKSILIPDVLDFISLIDNARYVLTDSFHGTAFAMNLNTEPICIYPNEFGGRIQSFLELIESEERHVDNYNDFSILENKVDFAKVNRILERERYKAHQFVLNVIKDYELNSKRGPKI